ncbi:hypothetical protein TKK_0007067 [Trichogramma kaykai]
MCDERHLQVEVDAVDNLGRTPLQLAVATILPSTVDLLLNRGADLSNIAFPADFGAGIDARVNYSSDVKLKMTSGALAIVESLENSGYDMDRSAALQIAALFDRHGLLFESTEALENFWRNDRQFANKAIELIVKPGLTLYELIQLGPREVAKLVTLKEFCKFVCTVQWNDIRRHQACIVHLSENMSRRFFRSWATIFLMELIHYRLPLECCEMIIDNSIMQNKDLCNICLAASIN